MSTCAKPGCSGSATSVLSYDYRESLAVLEDPGSESISPHDYALCSSCAEKLNPPRGWTLDDRRSRPPLFLDDARRAAPVNASAAETEDDDVDRGSTARQLFFGQSA